LVERDDPQVSISAQARLLDLNRTSLYYKPRGPSEEEVRLKHRIDEIFTSWPFYGSRRIREVLRQEGFVVNRKAVRRHMREMGIEAIYPGPNLSKRRHDHQVYPYLLRGVDIQEPNQVWGTDITYIRMAHGWMYLTAILDWYSRFVVAWELADTLEGGFVCDAVAKALSCSRPEILNSDQGSQFTSDDYIGLLNEAGVKISMDGRRRCQDNIFTERLWRTVKYEEVYLKDYGSPRQARQSLREYFDFYNEKRVHQALEYRTPGELHRGKKLKSK
jgi:putative transposase